MTLAVWSMVNGHKGEGRSTSPSTRRPVSARDGLNRELVTLLVPNQVARSSVSRSRGFRALMGADGPHTPSSTAQIGPEKRMGSDVLQSDY